MSAGKRTPTEDGKVLFTKLLKTFGIIFCNFNLFDDALSRHDFRFHSPQLPDWEIDLILGSFFELPKLDEKANITRKNDISNMEAILLYILSKNKPGYEKTFNFVINNWKEIKMDNRVFDDICCTERQSLRKIAQEMAVIERVRVQLAQQSAERRRTIDAENRADAAEKQLVVTAKEKDELKRELEMYKRKFGSIKKPSKQAKDKK
jgi:hypothetical protein